MTNQGRHITLTGILCYILLYVCAAYLYPGGSQAAAHSVGFDWMHNYWCDLLNAHAINGAINPARPLAIAASMILAGTVAYYFYTFPQKRMLLAPWHHFTRYGGILAMACAALLFTPYHDLVSIIGGFFGILALVGIFKALIQSGHKSLLRLGLWCMLLILLNNLIYFTTFGISALPLLQKFTLLFIFSWIFLVSRQTDRA